MTLYTFFKHHYDRVIPSFELFECVDDTDAHRHALWLMADRPYRSIEVANRAETAFTVSRRARSAAA